MTTENLLMSILGYDYGSGHGSGAYAGDGLWGVHHVYAME